MKFGQWLGLIALVAALYIVWQIRELLLLVFTTFFGALGLVMAIPLAVIVKTWLEEVAFKDVLDRWQKPT